MKTYYLHTIDKQPAYFSKSNGQIVFAEDDTWRDKSPAQYLRASVRQIRADQKKTLQNREKWGFKDAPGRYGYVRVVVPS